MSSHHKSLFTSHHRTTALYSIRSPRKGFFKRLFNPNSAPKKSKEFRHRDYVHKKFTNPYFHKSLIPKRTKAKKTKIFLLTLAIFGIIGTLLYHPFFDVRIIHIKGNQKISTQNIQDIVQSVLDERQLMILKEKNFFILHSDLISQELKKHYVFEKISISKSPFSVLNIEILERMPVVIVKSGNTMYYADKDGKSLGYADAQEADNTNFLNRLPQIWLNQEKSFALNDQIVSPATLQFIISLFKMIPDRTGIVLQGAILQDEEGRLPHIVTSEGWQIYVDRQNDWEKQVTVLKNILNIKFKNNNRAGLQYIDVRYENRVYIK